MAVSENLRPSYNEKTLHAMEAKREVNRITFTPSEASPGNTLCFRAQAERERGSGAGLASACL